MRYIIGIDLDGTLLTTDKKITNRTLAVIKQAVERGNIIVPITGRPLAGIPDEIKKCKEIEYIITSNGAVTYSQKEDKIIDNKCLPVCAPKQIYQKIGNLVSVFEVFVEGVAYEEEHSFQSIMQRYKLTNYVEYIKKSRKTVPGILEYLDSGKVDEISVMTGNTKFACKIKEEIQTITGIQIVETSKGEFEIYDKSAGKGNALLSLGEKLNISQECTVAIGDSNNDLDMMKKAAFSIAMENASHEVKEIADVITLSNDCDGVAEAIEKYII